LREAAAKYGNVTVLTWRADVPEDSAKLADAVRKEVGRLDVVIANAGASILPKHPLTTVHIP
jgi:NAD(P)-dependent dehydrogenase (short-subunit alcohol dehydrogenase family)